jgi:protein-L-isoaspartate(D-aspartate) O-methyltransferase
VTVQPLQPLLFTAQFRRKMGELSQRERLEWLSALTARLRAAASDNAALRLELREVARGCRLPLVESIERQLGPFERRLLDAALEVPREQFVRPEDIERSAEDTPLPLDDDGLATISAPHAYLLSYRLLDLGPGDALVELGTGSGYGAALAGFVIGDEGGVLTFEIDPNLADHAMHALARQPNIRVVSADAMTSAPLWGAATKVSVTFAIESLPGPWIDALPEGGMLVAPVGSGQRDQRLVLARRARGRIVESEHGAVRYVKNRSGG